MDGIYLVSGSSQGIGAAIAKKLAQHNFMVLGLCRKKYFPEHPLITPYQCDLNNLTDISELKKICAQKNIQGIIHSAGIVHLAPIASCTRQQWQQTYETNVIGAVMLTQAVLPQLRVSHGRVIFINSSQGKTVSSEWGAYAASKYALRAVADGLRKEEPKLGVTTIYPGRVATNMQRTVIDYEKKSYDPTLFSDPNTIADAVLTIITLPKDSLVEELTIKPAQYLKENTAHF